MAILLEFLLAFFVGAAIFIVYVLVRYVPIIERNAFEIPRHRPPDNPDIPRSVRMTEIRIPLRGRGDIPARYICAKKPSGKLVIFCHETGADWQSWYKHGSFLAEEDIDVLAFDHGGGKDAFQWPSVRELDIVKAVLEWVRKEKQDCRIALFGVSKGSSLAAAAGSHPLVKSVVLDGTFSTYTTLQDYMRRWIRIYVTHDGIARRVPGWIYVMLSRATLLYAGWRKGTRFFSIERSASKLSKPVLLIHAEKDHFVRVQQIERIRRLVRGPTDLWIAEGASHSDSVRMHPQVYCRRVMGFLKESLF